MAVNAARMAACPCAAAFLAIALTWMVARNAAIRATTSWRKRLAAVEVMVVGEEMRIG